MHPEDSDDLEFLFFVVVNLTAHGIQAIQSKDIQNDGYTSWIALLQKHELGYDESAWELLDVTSFSYVYLAARQKNKAVSIIKELMAHDFVTSAFVKPSGELPG